ncbi:sterol 26-hydroxylase, mitochondrial-like [Eublepharis macularius]|uniref:Sterol 26-hydroxylase, mitochondrial-like n=1 Tax=Eublepharis macularius TaxID=481883 RepID=A0AA97IVU3_EUBMA|nr:sterol 26-hydroxylase, mitochondrial-like [Eublepharis macularius]
MSFVSRGVFGWARWRSSRPKWTGICFQRRKATVGSAVAETPSRKTFQELPGVGFWSSVYWFLLRGYILHTHELQVIYKKLYGPMWKFVVGREISVSIASPEIMEKMMRQEGKYPMRCDMAEWKEHRNLKGLACGPLTEEGERWYHLRQVLNKRMLKPSEAVLYADVINEVVTDLMVHLQNEREKSPCGVVVQDVANQLYRFALEGISYILFETRIGCLQKQIPAKTQVFINSIGLMFKNFVFVNALPKWTREVLPFWNRYLESWDTIFAFGQKLIDKRMEEIAAQLEEGENPKGEYLTYLLSSGKLTIKEVSGSVAELLMAGVDTTSNTLAWTLYHLAKDTEIQDALFQEVVGVAPKDRIPSTEDLARMPLLKAIIKETLRLYPVVPINSRVAIKDVIIEGYHFPKGTLFSFCHFALSRDEANFPEPNKFVPRRWLREEHASAHHPFSSIPFGYGVRGCVGRRIAELEMHLALVRIIQKYEIRPDPQGSEVKPLARVVLVADRPINLQFLDRQTDDSSHAFG